MEYGLLVQNTSNIGDDLQSYAALRFLPRVNHFINREALSSFYSQQKTKLILNGWFTHNIFSFPPSSSIEPLVISFHGSDSISTKPWVRASYSAICSVFSFLPKSVYDKRFDSFFSSQKEIGARDLFTYNSFKDKGFNVYFSSCLTLTLKKQNILKTNRVVFNDLQPQIFPKTFIDFLEQKHEVVRLSHEINPFTSQGSRFKKVEELLSLYQSSQLVLTSRLHCLLPCIALGVPVIFVKPKLGLERFSGILDPLLGIDRKVLSMMSVDELMSFRNIENPFMEQVNLMEEKIMDFLRQDV